MLFRILFGAVVYCGLTSLAFAQQTTGALKGTVTDPLGSLVVGAKVTVRNARGVTTSATVNTSGVYEFRRLEAGIYELQIVSPGFSVFVEKNVEIRARELKTFDAQLEVAFEEQQVTVDDRNISTDSDNNANAIVLRGKDLETLPNDPQALAAALQAMAGPTDPESGGSAQVKVDGFSNGQMPPKEAIREVRINNNPFSAENEFPGWNGIEIFTQPGADKWHGNFSFDFNDESLNSRNPFTTVRAPYQQRGYNANLSGPIVPKRASFSIYVGRYSSDANSVVNATTLDPVTLKPVTINESFVTPDVNNYGNIRFDFKVNKKHTLVGRVAYNQGTQDLQGIGGFSLPSRAYRGRAHKLQPAVDRDRGHQREDDQRDAFSVQSPSLQSNECVECVCTECARLVQRWRSAGRFVVKRRRSHRVAELHFVDFGQSFSEDRCAPAAREDRQCFPRKLRWHVYVRGWAWSKA